MVAGVRFVTLAALAAVAVATLPPRQALGDYDPQAPRAALAHAGSSTAGLDLDGLEKRLRKTKSMDLFTKLALKVEFDNLVEDFRLYHDGAGNGAMDSLIGRFDGLMGKTLKLVREGDPALFRTLATSRHALRVVLVDPAKFAAALGSATRSFPRRQDR